MKDNTISNEYRVSVTEVRCILKYLPENRTNKIPRKFIKFLDENSIKGYKPNFDFSKGLDNIKLSNKTKTLLAMIYRNYITTKEEQEKYDEILLENEEKYQEELNKLYNPEDILKKDKLEEKPEEPLKNNEKILNNEEKGLVKYKGNIFNRFFRFLKRIFKRKR